PRGSENDIRLDTSQHHDGNFRGIEIVCDQANLVLNGSDLSSGIEADGQFVPHLSGASGNFADACLNPAIRNADFTDRPVIPASICDFETSLGALTEFHASEVSISRLGRDHNIGANVSGDWNTYSLRTDSLRAAKGHRDIDIRV